jgi:4-hydroxy-2-oxoheptanedioate aldolase
VLEEIIKLQAMKMRESRVLNKLRSGGMVCCIKQNLADAQATEIAALAGTDCVWVDREHIAQDWSILSSQVWASKSKDVDLLVRISRGSYSDYIKPLEMDATGIMVPHVMSADDARSIVKMTRFHPYGLRPIDGGSADGAYTRLDFQDYLTQANNQRFIILQIEDKEALSEIDAIAQVEGFDMLFFGPGDFSQSIAAPGDWNNPQLIEARKLVASTAKKYGKFAGTSSNISSLSELADSGYQFVNVAADVVGLSNYCVDTVQKFRSIELSKTSAESAKAVDAGKPY